jgi:hypothetical protein
MWQCDDGADLETFRSYLKRCPSQRRICSRGTEVL